jgi:hypothetical protein
MPAIVVCRISTGTIRLTDPDAIKFPGFEANPPNRPTPLASGSVIGWSRLLTDAQERFIDIRSTSRAIVAPLIGKRIELAKTIGCDAIVSENNDLPAYESPELGHGFAPVSYNEYVSWVAELSSRAHDQRISFGLRDATSLSIDGGTPSGTIAQLCDWVMEDRCGERRDCDLAQNALINRGKAVFDVEYNADEGGGTPRAQAQLDALCATVKGAGLGGIVKDNALSSAFYLPCM